MCAELCLRGDRARTQKRSWPINAGAGGADNDALPFCRERGLGVEALLTDNGREFCGTDSHPYDLYLELHDIRHKRTKVAHPQTNGSVERFDRAVLDECIRIAFRTTFYESVEALQPDLDAWLVYCNTKRPHQGYRVTVRVAGPSTPSTSTSPL